jgi:hypothetical protein
VVKIQNYKIAVNKTVFCFLRVFAKKPIKLPSSPDGRENPCVRVFRAQDWKDSRKPNLQKMPKPFASENKNIIFAKI